MTRHPGGTKRSSWLTFRRRLLLVRLLLRGPASSAELIAAVQSELGDEGYPPAAASALKHDLDALKAEYGCRIVFRRDQGVYGLQDLGELALLDMPAECMEALAFLDASFPAGAALPEHANIRALLDRVLRLLPATRQSEYGQPQATMRLRLNGGSGRIDPGALAVVKRAIEERRELAFKYWSSFDVDAPRRHRVAPYAIFFRPEGHGYVDATLLEVCPAAGETLHAAIDYRLDRIVPGTLQVLPAMLPPQRPYPRPYALRYRLRPAVARRRDVAAYFPNTQIAYHEDGGATVTAAVTNLWQTRQILLRYGDACEVLGPPELVALFSQTARGLARLYGEEMYEVGESR
ncbi:MAG: WYL domain-containing protein [Kouleothrix sp.]|nr:WYL domain-containing protein [Kouleothrix sp.]